MPAKLHTPDISKTNTIDKARGQERYVLDVAVQSDATGHATETLAGEKTEEKGGNYKDSHKIVDQISPLNKPKKLRKKLSLRSLEILDSPKVKKLRKRLSLRSLDVLDSPKVNDAKKMRKRSSLRSLDVMDSSKLNDLSNMKTMEKFRKTRKTEKKSAIIPSNNPKNNLSEARRKVDEARERAIAIRNRDSRKTNDNNTKTEGFEEENDARSKNQSLTDNESLLKTHIRSKEDPLSKVDRSNRSANRSILSQTSTSPMYHMIRETDRLSGFIRRYEKKLESVCKSLLTLASGTGREKEQLAARQLDLPEILQFIVEQDWYKEHSPDSKSTDTPFFMFSKNRNGDASVGNKGYTITATGKLFLQIDGPMQSDVCRFLTFLDRMNVGLTRDVMLEQWKEITQLSGDVQSQRVCDKLDKLISFCVDSHLIQK